MIKFWKSFTLFGEIFLFIPAFCVIFFINISNISSFGKLSYLVDFFSKYIFFLTKEQIFVLLFFLINFLIVDFIGSLIKLFFFKPRPVPMEYGNFIEKILAGSFPSLHSARTFVLFLIVLNFTNYTVSIFYFIFWLLISYSRVVLKKHYWIDIFGGVILATIVYLFTSFLFL